MGDGAQENLSESLLSGFSFSPDWAKTSATDHSAKLGRMADRFDRGDDGEKDFRRHDRRGPFRDGDRRGGFRDGDRRGPFRDGDRRDGQWRKPRRERDDGAGRSFGGGGGLPRQANNWSSRRNEDAEGRGGAPFEQRRERRAWTPPPYSIRFVPDQAALNLVARKLASSHKAMPLRDIVKIFFANPDSTLVRLEWDEEHKESKFHQCRSCGWFSDSEDALRQHLLSAHFAEHFSPAQVETEPPSGTFAAVAKCGITGRLIAPPNHHSFNRRVLEMLSLPECAGISEAEYRARIERVTDPEAIEQWRKEASVQTLWARKAAEGAESEEKRFSREEAESLFFSEIAPGLVKHSRSVTASRAVSTSLGGGKILYDIRREWDHEQRLPVSPLHFAIRGGLKSRRLAVFRIAGGRKDEFVAPRAPVPLNATSTVPELKEILDFVRRHGDCTKAELLEALVGDGSDASRAAAIQKQLAFLFDRGHLLEFTSGKLALPGDNRQEAPQETAPAEAPQENAAADAPQGEVVAAETTDGTAEAPADASGDVARE